MEDYITGGLFIIEPTSPKLASLFKVKKVFVTEKTPYQEIMLAELEDFGRALIIDNLIQSTERDEYIYHESLVHPAMVLHPNPRKVLIIGGGEGATLREVLKHKTVEEAVMVDIDEKVVEFSKKYLEYMHQGSFYDKRAKVIIMDGLKYVKEAPNNYYDVVILDLTDPYAGEVAKPLYSEKFYREIHRILGEDGVVVTQAGNSFYYREAYDYVYNNLSKVFPHLAEYWVWIPSFNYTCNFILGSKTYDPGKMGEEEIDRILMVRGVKTKFFNGKRFIGLLKQGIIKG
ncbi:polyamine aminopropyltransferase [Staphylothermus hellenicus]|uniref:Polyamine aminopropyltransferase n=1 Tax=Staphylothermus hellenicus (strain DSM 12710 / JCM 10830 / BK20S6-10-b1 / P8) TaxID=591019 RepID=D7D8M1_STAHD|nr:polyamine aminopropyltransferase [Staphylothermus hellenicus]ADI32117.1 Spermine synthase [Staphylothermus hellenicus DSM 12710]